MLVVETFGASILVEVESTGGFWFCGMLGKDWYKGGIGP
jgi:hypothetical protein